MPGTWVFEGGPRYVGGNAYGYGYAPRAYIGGFRGGDRGFDRGGDRERGGFRPQPERRFEGNRGNGFRR
jgi:hypothetical protein